MDVDPRRYDHVFVCVRLYMPKKEIVMKRLGYLVETEIVISENDIHSIVTSYLVHNCHKETAESFIACTGMKQSADYIEDMEKRKRIINFITEGDALKAIELTEQFAHDLLEKNVELHFDLLSLHFVNLVISRKCTEALEFAQIKLTPFGKMEKYVNKLEDFLALLAYDEPEKSPMFHFLNPEYRQEVAESLNQAILEYTNLPSYTAMERLIKQTTVVRQCLSEETEKDGLPPFSLKDFLRS